MASPIAAIGCLSLHDALPILGRPLSLLLSRRGIDTTVIQVHSKTPDIADEIQRADIVIAALGRSEEHTSELQSRGHLVCRLLLEKKKIREDHGDGGLNSRL